MELSDSQVVPARPGSDARWQSSRVRLVDPNTHLPLHLVNGAFRKEDGEVVAPVVDGVPRFVRTSSADPFAFQWTHWHSTLSDSRNPGVGKYELLLRRTRFDSYKTEGATLLECGMGGGDDTEALLRLPFGELHAFDVSNAVERSTRYLTDQRLRILQASIFAMPYADQSFDFVFCHRVLQHTNDPAAALVCVCRKVKPGGVLFVHSYKRSWRYMLNYKYKVRWLTKRLPHRYIHRYVATYGAAFRALHKRLHRFGRIGQAISFQLVPFEYFPTYGDFREEQLLELDKLVTFDALTPAHDHPMTSAAFRRIIEGEGFRIEHMHDPPTSPLWCTAIRRPS